MQTKPTIREMIQISIDKEKTPQDLLCATCTNDTCKCRACKGRDTSYGCHGPKQDFGRGGCMWDDNTTSCYSFKGQ